MKFAKPVLMAIVCTLPFAEPALAQKAPPICQMANTSVLVLTMASGIPLTFTLDRADSKLQGSVQFDGARPGEPGGRGRATGEFSGNFLFLEVRWEDGTQAHFRGELKNGAGKGDAFHSEAKDTRVSWTAHTLDGCSLWPDGTSSAATSVPSAAPFRTTAPATTTPPATAVAPVTEAPPPPVTPPTTTTSTTSSKPAKRSTSTQSSTRTVSTARTVSAPPAARCAEGLVQLPSGECASPGGQSGGAGILGGLGLGGLGIGGGGGGVGTGGGGVGGGTLPTDCGPNQLATRVGCVSLQGRDIHIQGPLFPGGVQIPIKKKKKKDEQTQQQPPTQQQTQQQQQQQQQQQSTTIGNPISMTIQNLLARPRQ